MWLAAPALACFAGADLLRASSPGPATAISMAAWACLTLQVLVWMAGGNGWRATCAWLARVLVVSAAALGALYLYYARAAYLDAGVNIDMIYTYEGLQWFLELRNPITLVGGTRSYHQLAFAFLTHLPGVLIGVGRIGPLAIHLGGMVEMAFLLAVVGCHLAPGSLARQIAATVLAAAVFSDRLMILTYNTVGYALPLVALGLMLAVVAASKTREEPDRLVGGLAAVALLHHYPGWTMVLPFVVAWLVVRRNPVAKTLAFLRANPFLATIAGLAVITMVLQPDLVFGRIHDVTKAKTGQVGGLVDRAWSNWELMPHFLRVRFHDFVEDNPGSLLLLNLPPLGGWALPIMAVTWVTSALALRGHALRYLGMLVVIVGGLATLTAAQHILTDFYDYRDLPLIHGATVVGLVFAFRSVSISGWRGGFATAIALAIASYNWADVTALRGRRFNYHEYAPRAQEAYERLRAIETSPAFRRLGVTRVVIVGEEMVALAPLYANALEPKHMVVQPVKLSEYCHRPAASVATAAGPACDPFLLFVPLATCRGRTPIPSTEAALGLTTKLYPSVCDRPEQRVRVSEPILFAP